MRLSKQIFIRTRRFTNTHKYTLLTFEHWADLPDSQTSQAGELTEGQLEEKERNAAEDQHDEVW